MADPRLTNIVDWFKVLQDRICSGLEELDGTASFSEDKWQRPEGGGGRSRVIQGEHIEKGGVMFSAIDGDMPEVIANGLGIDATHFHATGVSIVLHPHNPWVPIIHMNVRYFETASGLWWFGGGIDVTPHYINIAQATRFHKRMKRACDILSAEAYDEYKPWADRYFFNVHRDETRGVGGIFFDRLNKSSGASKETCWAFVQAVGEAFLMCYKELFEDNNDKAFDESHKRWQQIRRGRYVEFNLVYDRGTKFGLQTNGRIESILMSMPPQTQWVYNHQPDPHSEEAQTLALLKKDIDWLNYKAV